MKPLIFNARHISLEPLKKRLKPAVNNEKKLIRDRKFKYGKWKKCEFLYCN
ncbi:MAG: hypothetical protein KatS3mg095_0648 [Candidatus Parcubacteria bacterium]|nr:MAG: hypothetical protein KatS3mg095_0648 [Candidatus Parcubacteria bacterium]